MSSSPQPRSSTPLRPYPVIPAAIQPSAPSLAPESPAQTPGNQQGSFIPGVTDSGFFRVRPVSPPSVPPMVVEEPTPPLPIYSQQNPWERLAGETAEARPHGLHNAPVPTSLAPGPTAHQSAQLAGGSGAPTGRAAVPTASCMPTPDAALHWPQQQPDPAPAAPSRPKCAICWERPIEMGFLHGEDMHQCACRSCASIMQVGNPCPICRKTIERIVRAFVAEMDAPEPSHPEPPSPEPPSPWGPPLLGHGSQINSLAFSPSCHLLASASDDRSARIWNVDTASQAAVLSHSARVTAVAFSPDGMLCVTATEDMKLRVFSTHDFQPTGVVFTGHTSRVNAVASSNHQGNPVCVSGANGGSIKVWCLLTGECWATMAGTTGNVLSVTVSADGKTVISSGFDRAVRVWDLATGSLKHALIGHAGAPCNVFSVCASPAARSTLCVSAGMDRSVRVWDFEAGRCTHVFLEAHTDWVRAVALSADGTTCYSASSDRTVKVWDLVARQPRQTQEGLHTDIIKALAVARTGMVASASADKTIRIWHNV